MPVPFRGRPALMPTRPPAPPTGGGTGAVGVQAVGGTLQILDQYTPGHWAVVAAPPAAGSGSGPYRAGAAYAHVALIDKGGGASEPGPWGGELPWGTTASAPAWEVDGRTDVPAGARVWLEPSLSEDRPGWLFRYAGAAAAGAGDCNSCAFLLSVKTTAVLRARVKGGYGRCGCVAPDETPEFKLFWNGDASEWQGTRPVVACCGCAALAFSVNPAEPLGSMAAGRLTLNRSCQDGEGEYTAVNVTLRHLCCGRTAEGRPFVKLGAVSEDACDGPEADCENHLEITVECDACDLENPECEGCIEYEGPPYYRLAVSFTGAYARFTGVFFLRGVAAACAWAWACERTGTSYTYALLTEGTAESPLYRQRLVIADGDYTLVWERTSLDRPKCFEPGGISLLYRDTPGGDPATPPTGVQPSLGVVPTYCAYRPCGCGSPYGWPETITVTVPGSDPWSGTYVLPRITYTADTLIYEYRSPPMTPFACSPAYDGEPLTLDGVWYGVTCSVVGADVQYLFTMSFASEGSSLVMCSHSVVLRGRCCNGTARPLRMSGVLAADTPGLCTCAAGVGVEVAGACEAIVTAEAFAAAAVSRRPAVAAAAPPALPSGRPCRHELGVVSAAPCGDPARHVRQCGHDAGPDLCVRGATRDPAAVRSCRGCPLFEAADPAPPPGPAAVVPGLPDPLPGPAAAPADWPRRPDVVARHRDALAAVVAAAKGLRYPGGAGTGVVTVGGGRYWPGVVAGVRLMRELGIGLPVEAWHRGRSGEPVRPADLAGLGAEVIDLDAVAAARGDSRIPTGDPGRGGWEAKLYALTHTRFDTVLFLDADAYLVGDPAPVLAAARSHPSGWAVWEDLPNTTHAVAWPAVWPAGPAGVPPVQGGQYAVHRPAAWPVLAVAHWMCQHSDYFFQHGYGDQDALRVAMAALGVAPLVLGPAPWAAPAFVCPAAPGGPPVVVHRCQAKLFPAAGPPPRHPHLPLEDRIHALLPAAAAD